LDIDVCIGISHQKKGNGNPTKDYFKFSMTIEKKTCIKFCTIVAFCLQIYRHVLYANQPLQFVKSPLCTKTKTFLQQKKEMEKWCNCEKFRLCNCTRKKHVVEEVEGENSTRQPPC
jgi:hypothetical protein